MRGHALPALRGAESLKFGGQCRRFAQKEEVGPKVCGILPEEVHFILEGRADGRQHTVMFRCIRQARLFR
jgi:hypothetical protein